MTLDESKRLDYILRIDGIQISVEAGTWQYVEDYVVDLVEILKDRRLIVMDPDLMI